MTQPLILDMHGKVVESTEMGGYPIIYYTQDGDPVCGKCINDNMALCTDPENREWFIWAHDINWEDETILCDNCGAALPCAYPTDKPGDNGGGTQAAPDLGQQPTLPTVPPWVL